MREFKKEMKKIFSLLLVLTVIISMTPTSVRAESIGGQETVTNSSTESSGTTTATTEEVKVESTTAEKAEATTEATTEAEVPTEATTAVEATTEATTEAEATTTEETTEAEATTEATTATEEPTDPLKLSQEDRATLEALLDEVKSLELESGKDRVIEQIQEALDNGTDAEGIAQIQQMVEKLKDSALMMRKAGDEEFKEFLSEYLDSYVALSEEVKEKITEDWLNYDFSEEDKEVLLAAQKAKEEADNRPKDAKLKRLKFEKMKAAIPILEKVAIEKLGKYYTSNFGAVNGGSKILSKDDSEEYYTYCAAAELAYPDGKVYFYKSDKDPFPKDTNREAVARALDAGYPNDAFGLSKALLDPNDENDTIAKHEMGAAVYTQEVIWKILNQKNNALSDKYSKALYDYAMGTTDVPVVGKERYERVNKADATVEAVDRRGYLNFKYDDATKSYIAPVNIVPNKVLAGKEIEITRIPTNSKLYRVEADGAKTELRSDSGNIKFTIGEATTLELVANGDPEKFPVQGELAFSYTAYEIVDGNSFHTFMPVVNTWREDKDTNKENEKLKWLWGYKGELNPYQPMIGFQMKKILGSTVIKGFSHDEKPYPKPGPDDPKPGPDDPKPGPDDPNPTPTPTPNPNPNPTPDTSTEIPDEDVPKDDIPVIEIPDGNVPLGDIELPTEDIEDEDVPLSDLPDETIDIEDEDVPLSDQTPEDDSKPKKQKTQITEIEEEPTPLADLPKTGEEESSLPFVILGGGAFLMFAVSDLLEKMKKRAE